LYLDNYDNVGDLSKITGMITLLAQELRPSWGEPKIKSLMHFKLDGIYHGRLTSVADSLGRVITTNDPELEKILTKNLPRRDLLGVISSLSKMGAKRQKTYILALDEYSDTARNIIEYIPRFRKASVMAAQYYLVCKYLPECQPPDVSDRIIQLTHSIDPSACADMLNIVSQNLPL
jgi:hypothetical protein